MRIGVNTRLLIKGKMDGIGWFAYETLRRVVEGHPEHQFIFFFDRKPAEEFVFASNVTPVTLCPPARHPVLWYLFFQYSLKRALKRYKIDVFLSPDGFIPLRCSIPVIDVIHDLNFEHSRGNLRGSHQRYMTHFFPRYARASTRVATVSQFSRHDIAQTYGLSLDKIDVVYNGASDMYRPYGDGVREMMRRDYAGGRPFFLFVSTILKRKNLQSLLAAFDSLRNRHDIALVVV